MDSPGLIAGALLLSDHAYLTGSIMNRKVTLIFWRNES